ncbi:signal peptidase I [Saitoella complicata NRRL Y-17804]|uniref:signal peptidase I n=1 Tax=Saitoella complicata (strain BCRC 22490 / CBS 7301 / JCM 7358 / NBRC 10748 / NRRL Y-17804) TaxID=698492 RepID=UPI0008676685|nr:signal peptidase I [Saitoella complicata NRRL Y-17804]ODQ51625.1 signal peptidase I [Saitoella complicata NRRL Y-17804]
MNIRQQAGQFLNFLLVLTTAFALWKGLSLYTNSSSPIVVVLSGSMEPAFQRGDLLFLSNRAEKAQVGDIVVYEVKGRPIPIVHRVMRTHDSLISDLADQKLLTKGDNNPTDDLELYARGQTHLSRESEVVGMVRGFVPYVGMVTIMLNDYPWMKYALLAGLGGMVMLQRE